MYKGDLYTICTVCHSLLASFYLREKIVPAEVGGDDAWVEAVGGNAGAAEAAGQLAAEEDIGELGLRRKMPLWYRRWQCFMF